MKRFIKLLFILVIFIGLSGCDTKEDNKKLKIVSTSFPGYDFTRAIIKDVSNIEVKMLLKPGSELHDFEPTPKDIKDIKNSDIFIYVGGDSDEWIEDILSEINQKKTKLIKLMDLIETKEEEIVEGMEKEDDEEEEKEYDEHVWTSPINAIIITSKLKDEIIKKDPDNKELYLKNSTNYINALNEIDEEIIEVVNNAKRKELIFADRFPLRYFVDRYNLSYYAAFPGCSEKTEASAKTIAFLIDKVKKDEIPIIFHNELTNGKIAETIKKETNAKVLEFNSLHNVSQEQFNKGITYIDIMKDNIKALKEALN